MKTIRMKNMGRACTVYEYNGWYAVRGAVEVNRTAPESLQPGEDVCNNEKVKDFDFFISDKPVNSMKDLIRAVKS